MEAVRRGVKAAIEGHGALFQFSPEGFVGLLVEEAAPGKFFDEGHGERLQ
jgi:hypothetical protein